MDLNKERNLNFCWITIDVIRNDLCYNFLIQNFSYIYHFEGKEHPCSLNPNQGYEGFKKFMIKIENPNHDFDMITGL